MKQDSSSTPSVGWVARLQEKWALQSVWQVIAVLVTFSLAGSSVVILRKQLFWLLGFDQETVWWVKTVTYILLIFPMYQILLLAYGFLLGQFSFFWEKEKKLMRWFGRKLGLRKS